MNGAATFPIGIAVVELLLFGFLAKQTPWMWLAFFFFGVPGAIYLVKLGIQLDKNEQQ